MGWLGTTVLRNLHGRQVLQQSEWYGQSCIHHRSDVPSNALLILVPLMPNVYWAVALLLVRFSISQMDVPTRQAYTMAVVRPDERSAAAGITAVARFIGASISAMLATVLVGTAGLMSLPFFFAGGLKIVYDVLLYRAFSRSASSEHR